MTVPTICAAVVLLATMSTAAFAWIVCPAYGRSRWTAIVWALYGAGTASLCFVSLDFALFSLGIVAPLLSQNVSQLMAVRVFGPEAHRRQLAILIHRGGRAAFLTGSLVTLGLRASVPIVLLLLAPHGPVAWLAGGLLASPLGALAATVRLVIQPPPLEPQGSEPTAEDAG